ncbi:MFS transporter [Vulcanibacillus modesticaldus]|uniref:MFS transporter n=1 Tax=Vulcanibacillus modesticaldus TaxID=337097 RepID=UPI000AAF6308|nr:MFS transporter [Vulcanibacillus modesticaldus]
MLFLPASLIGGKLADSISRKKIIIIFDSFAAITYLIIAFMEPSMNLVYLIMIAAMFMGIGEPAHNSLIADITTPKNRDGAYSLSYLGFNIGFAIGPLLGGILFKNYFKLIFIIDALTALIATFLIFIFIQETIDRTKEEFSEERKLEKRVEGSIFKVLLERPILIYFSLIMFGYNFVYSQWGFLLPIHVEYNYPELGSQIYGMLASFNGLVVMFFTPLVTMLLMKNNNFRKIVYGGILYIIGFGMLGFISSKAVFFLSVFIFTIGEITVTISFMPLIANYTPASHRGRMNSILPLIMGLGFTLGPLGMGMILEYYSIESSWRMVGVLMVFSTILMLLLEKLDGVQQKRLVKKETKERTLVHN